MAENTRERPLSPHLQIYRPQLTTVMSIFHRFAGAALAVGTLAVAWGLLAAASGAGGWTQFHDVFATPLGRLMVSGWALAFFYHLSNGVRHLTWDTVHALDIKSAYRAGYAVIAATILLTGFAWAHIWMGANP